MRSRAALEVVEAQSSSAGPLLLRSITVVAGSLGRMGEAFTGAYLAVRLLAGFARTQACC